jgi:hypothetical protein
VSYAAAFAFRKNFSPQGRGGSRPSGRLCRTMKTFATRREAERNARELAKENAGFLSTVRVIRTHEPANFCYRDGQLVPVKS